MGEPLWDPKLSLVFRIQVGPNPLTKGRGALAQVNGHIKNRTGASPDQFGLRLWCQLVVQSPQNALDRVVVLGKDHALANGLVEFALVPAFKEPAAVVAEDGRCDQQGAFNRSPPWAAQLFNLHHSPPGCFAERHGR